MTDTPPVARHFCRVRRARDIIRVLLLLYYISYDWATFASRVVYRLSRAQDDAQRGKRGAGGGGRRGAVKTLTTVQVAPIFTTA